MNNITLEQWMKAVNFRITDGSEYLWSSYGKEPYRLEFWDQRPNGVGSSIVFDRKTQVVAEVSVCDYEKDRAYRFINPDYLKQYKKECKSRGVEFDEAWDDVRYVDLELAEDMIEKLTAIVNYQPYDTRVQVPIEFSDAELLQYMKLAHEMDITFNELVERALTTAMENEQRLRKS